MTQHPLSPNNSERGIALIAVLLLLAVLSGLVTGLSFSGHVESSMAENEVYFAGARAAAEGGMNRAITAILADTTNNLLYGNDDTAGTADDGDIGFLMTGFTAWPEALGADGQYSYTIEIFDDDNNALYATPLTAAQLTAMGEDPDANGVGDPTVNENDRLILRATGFGPKNTVVRISRILESVDTTSPGTPVSTLSNPAILCDGDIVMDGNFNIDGLEGNVHSNGDIDVSGVAGNISGDLTAVGAVTASDGFHADGTQAGGAATITVPNIDAADYVSYADYFLNADGSMTVGSPTGPACGALCDGWSHSGGEWSITGNTAATGTFYVEGTVVISGSPGSAKAPMALSIIATDSISITGHPYLTPENDALLQFVTNGDLKLAGAVDADDPTTVEGRSLVREQLSISGNPELQQQIIVQDVDSVSNVVTVNSISGTPHITYNGSFDPIETIEFIPGTTTYVNNISGWMES